jgi:hypothetical protein
MEAAVAAAAGFFGAAALFFVVIFFFVTRAKSLVLPQKNREFSDFPVLRVGECNKGSSKGYKNFAAKSSPQIRVESGSKERV